ncbi:hypothetical protein QYE76_026943 [Lolium multiflorum]|uniref:Uncharacterized protein n=1 Tax=Lolium multiflorum TaxID=4521 RepID=A0AAD8VDZ5_LOLMU|nr:hypothetical protein QYE76_026943 [Lolium multiflorum]
METRLRGAGLLGVSSVLVARAPAAPTPTPYIALSLLPTSPGRGEPRYVPPCGYCHMHGHPKTDCFKKQLDLRNGVLTTSTGPRAPLQRPPPPISPSRTLRSFGASWLFFNGALLPLWPVLLNIQGTLAQFSCSGAHTQNGVPKRKHRHLLETARAMMIVAFLPAHFWVEVASISTFHINLRPSTALQGGPCSSEPLHFRPHTFFTHQILLSTLATFPTFLPDVSFLAYGDSSLPVSLLSSSM